jgi:hypothetical protein
MCTSGADIMTVAKRKAIVVVVYVHLMVHILQMSGSVTVQLQKVGTYPESTCVSVCPPLKRRTVPLGIGRANQAMKPQHRTPGATVPLADMATVLGESHWRTVAIALLSVRITQGFIYWGGGSRRFLYDPQKLDPDAHSWMAEKFQSAMPGALLGTDQLIAFLLQHFWLLYTGLILFSAAELIAGLALVAGLRWGRH